MTPIFIMSLPRSGSTLLQRALVSHRDISSVSEPWFLLPLMYPLHDHGVRAEFTQSLLRQAMRDLLLKLPGGRQDYLDAIRQAGLHIYDALNETESKFFIDKTPRYHLIVDELIDAFPDSKFIFLWRNPLSIVASIIESWGNGRWSVPASYLDLYTGMSNLLPAMSRLDQRAIAVKYEDLVQSPGSCIARLYQFLGVDPQDSALSALPKLDGALGDDSLNGNNESINMKSLEKWQPVLANPFRKSWCARYLKWLGRSRLEQMGYDYQLLQDELGSNRATMKYLLNDTVRHAHGVIRFRIKNRWVYGRV